MEDCSSVGISIRNMPVRLNEGNVENETICECKKNLYGSASAGNDPHFNETFETSLSCNNLPVSSDICNSHDHRTNDDCDLINGCNKFLQKDLKCVHISVNGLNKCGNYELLNAHLDELNRVRCGHTVESTTMIRTEPSLADCQNSVAPVENSLHTKNEICDVESLVKTVECNLSVESSCREDADIVYLGYESENQMPDIIRLIQKDLSEPYSIYTYRYFIHNWPKLCFLALHRDKCVGAIVCKLDVHKKHSRRGYIAMLAVDENYRKRKIGSSLVLKAIDAMVEDSADEVVLETEITNKPALKLYENLGFVRDKRLFRYYLNGVDALRLKLWLR